MISTSRSFARRGALAARLASACAALALLVAPAGCGGDRSADVRPDAERTPPGWTTFEDPERGFSVALPPTWRRAERNLTPHLGRPGRPYELLSAATFPLRPGGPCAHMPAKALRQMSLRDVFVSIQEHGGGIRAEAPLRPRPFPLPQSRRRRTDPAICTDRGPRFRYSFKLFRDAGRAFYAIVAVGQSASNVERSNVVRVLDSFRFEPCPPARSLRECASDLESRHVGPRERAGHDRRGTARGGPARIRVDRAR